MGMYQAPGVVYPPLGSQSVMVDMLPYMEQNAINNAYNFNVAVYDGPNFTIVVSSVNSYICPSDAAAATATPTQSGAGVPGTFIMFGISPAHGNYRACMGTFPDNDLGQNPPTGFTASQALAKANCNGIYGYWSSTTVASITDGTSNTIAFSETAIGLLPTNLQSSYGLWSWCGWTATESRATFVRGIRYQRPEAASQCWDFRKRWTSDGLPELLHRRPDHRGDGEQLPSRRGQPCLRRWFGEVHQGLDRHLAPGLQREFPPRVHVCRQQ